MTTSTNVQHFPIDRFLSAASLDQLPPKMHEAISDYLQHFAIFDDVVLRCRCGRNLGGLPGTVEAALGLTTFAWGLVNGEGECYDCHWPARGLHRITVEGHENPLFFQVPLPYHPDFVTEASS